MKYRYRLEEKSERRLGFVRLIRRLAIFALFFYRLLSPVPFLGPEASGFRGKSKRSFPYTP